MYDGNNVRRSIQNALLPSYSRDVLRNHHPRTIGIPYGFLFMIWRLISIKMIWRINVKHYDMEIDYFRLE